MSTLRCLCRGKNGMQKSGGFTDVHEMFHQKPKMPTLQVEPEETSGGHQGQQSSSSEGYESYETVWNKVVQQQADVVFNKYTVMCKSLRLVWRNAII